MKKQHPLRELLDARGVRVADAARAAELNQDVVYNVLAYRNDPKLSTVRKLTNFAKTLDPSVTVEDLFCEREAC